MFLSTRSNEEFMFAVERRTRTKRPAFFFRERKHMFYFTTMAVQKFDITQRDIFMLVISKAG